MNTQETRELNELKNKKDEDILALSVLSPSAFEELVDRYQEPFLRTAMKIVLRKEEAEDVVQEAFVKIYKNAGKFKKIEGASFKSWAYKILSNTALNEYKKLKLDFERFENYNPEKHDLAVDSEQSNPVKAELADMKSFIFKALNKLPASLSSVIQKYYMEDKSQKTIAEEEGVSATAVKMRLFRAKKAFKKIANGEKTLSWTI